MYRKTDYRTESYDRDGIRILPVDVAEETEVGGWYDRYNWLALTYVSDKERNMHYGDIAYKMTMDTEIIGYFIAQAEVCTEDDGFLKKSEKKLVLYDLSLDSEEKVKHGRILIDYLLYVAEKHGCSAVEILTREDFLLFRCFIECHYEVAEHGGYSYIKTKNPECKAEAEHLRAYGDDGIFLDELYFLWGIKFDIDRDKCVRSFGEGESISVDRKSGCITFPSNVINLGDEIILDGRTRNLVHYVVRARTYMDNQTIYLGKKMGNITIEACTDTELCVFDEAENVIKDFYLGYFAYRNGYSSVWAYSIGFDIDKGSYSEGITNIPIAKRILPNACYVDRERGKNLPEEIKYRKRAKAFTERMNGLLRFDFKLGEGEEEKRLSLILGDKVRAEHNGTLDNAQVEYDKAAVTDQLCLVHFENWNAEYIGDSETDNGIWEITLEFPDGVLSYKGKGSYPKIWFAVADIIEQYSGHVITPR